MIDQQISHYRILRPLGRGGMATVYLAEQLGLRRQVALKILHSHLAADETIVERFLREARIAASLQHQRIVTIYDVGEERGVYYIAMRYIDGESFGQLLRREGPLAPARALDLLQQVSDALDFAHTRGVLHRDVKPANVMVEPGDVLTLTDFGIARAGHQSGLTAAHTVIGTPAYMSPEQARGALIDKRSDLYALGIMLYEALGGRPPFRADNTTALLFMHVHQPPPPLQEIRPELPPALCAVVARALAKSPDERYQSGRAMIAAARRALAGQPDDTGEGATMMVGASQVASPASAPPASAQYADWPSGPPSGPVVAPFGAAPLNPPASVGMAAPAVAPVVAPTAYYSTAEPYQATLTPAPVPYGPPPGRPAGAATTTPWPPTAVPPGYAQPAQHAPTTDLRAATYDLPAGNAPAPPARTLPAVWLASVALLLAGLALGAIVVGQHEAIGRLLPPTAPTEVAITARTAEPAPVATAQPPAAIASSPPSVAAAPPTVARPTDTRPTVAPTTPPAPAPTPGARARIGQAQDSLASGDFPSAIQQLEQLRRDPAAQADRELAALIDDTLCSVHLAYGEHLLRLNSYDASDAEFHAALGLRPKDDRALDGQKRVALARQYAIMEASWSRDESAAISALEEIMRIDGDYRDARHKLHALLIGKADRLLAVGDRDGAYPFLMRALSVQPGSPEAFQRLKPYTPIPAAPTQAPQPAPPPAPPPAGQPTPFTPSSKPV